MKYLSAYYWQQEEQPGTSLVLQQLMYPKKKLPVFFACICTGKSRGEQAEVILASYFTEQLTDWLRREGRTLCVKGRKGDFIPVEKSLRQAIARIEKEMGEYAASERRTEGMKGQEGKGETTANYAGIIAVGDCCLWFGRGDCSIFLLNTRFDRPHTERLLGEETMEHGEENTDLGEKSTEHGGESTEYGGESTEHEEESTELVGKIPELIIERGIMQPGIGLLVATRDYRNKVTRQQLQECLAVKELALTREPGRRVRALGEEAARNGGRHMGAILLVTCEK